MGNPEHIAIIQNSTVEEWNKWRLENLKIRPDLTRADLSNRDLSGIDLRGCGLFKTNFSKASLRNANLRQSIAIAANFSGSDLSGAHVYGISAWDVKVSAETKQLDLVITAPNESIITCDDLRLAQFLHLMLNNQNIRDIIQVLSNKAILILGRFANGHLDILQSLKAEIRSHDYIPILFDFEGPQNRSLTETVITLASLSKAVVCDLSYPACIPQELYATVPHFQSVIFQPIIQECLRPYAMFSELLKYPWVKQPIHYQNIKDVVPALLSEF